MSWNRTHGMSNTRLYWVWKSMIGRCNDPGNKDYADYGGRGVAVCEQWSEFVPFHDWALSHGYAGGLTLERTKNNLGYGPDNCRWATRHEQARNKRNNRIVSFRGRSLTIAEWAESLGIPAYIISRRLRDGWAEDQAVGSPVQTMAQERVLSFRGRTLPLAEWAKVLRIRRDTISARLDRGWTVERALGEPVNS